MTTITEQTTPLPEVPYRGIESFRFVDQRLFCAREEETWELLSSVLINRGVLLYGDSGSGKSSLINAGLIPAALKDNLLPHRLRIQPRRDREIKVERISTETDEGPPYLPSIFVDPKDTALSLEISLEQFLAQLKRTKHEGPCPLLILDQFEEFITLFEQTAHTENDGTVKDVADQEEILNVLTALLQDEELPVKLLFVFREEYLAKLNILFKAAPELLDQYVRLLPPRVQETERIILAPFIDEESKAKFGDTASRQHVDELQGQLAKTIAAQIQQRSENGFINLTELQIVCRKLWESEDPVKYFEANDSKIQKVLEGYWADALTKLGNLYEPAIALLGHMVTSTNTRNIVSEPSLRFYERDNFTEEQITKALNALVESRLVQREPRHKIYFYEIVSEFLVPWIQEKKAARLAQIKADRLAAETKQKLKQVEKERRIFMVLGVVLLAGLLVSGFLYFKQKRLQAELKTERDKSENLVRLLNQLTGSDQDRLAAVNGLIELDKDGNLDRDLIPVIVAVTANDDNHAVSTAASYFYNALKETKVIDQSDTELTDSIIKTAQEKNTALTQTASSTSLPPRVYFQLANDSQRPRADKIADALRSIGFTIPAYEVVEGSPRNNQLRYSKTQSDSDAAYAGNRDRALAKIKEADGSNWSPVALRSSSSAGAGHFELWFASDRAPTTTETPSPTPSPTSTPTATPTPSNDLVTLKFDFVDEQGKELSIKKPEVYLLKSSNGRTSNYGGLDTVFRVPPGVYQLTIYVDGYKPNRGTIILSDPEVTRKIKLIPKERPSTSPER